MPAAIAALQPQPMASPGLAGAVPGGDAAAAADARTRGRWTLTEMDALLEGVKREGYSWAKIKAANQLLAKWCGLQCAP